MSRLVTNQMSSGISGPLVIERGNSLVYPKAIVQTKYIETRDKGVFSSPTTGNGTEITSLRIPITPKYSTSLLYMQWVVNGELHQDNVFTIFRDGALITTAGVEGYNNLAGNVRWSGVAVADYDLNESSTPSNWSIQYFQPALTTASRTYSLAVRGSGASAYTFYLNRTVGSTGGGASYESSMSMGIAMEIAA